jgi:hypothetical protein
LIPPASRTNGIPASCKFAGWSSFAAHTEAFSRLLLTKREEAVNKERKLLNVNRLLKVSSLN